MKIIFYLLLLSTSYSLKSMISETSYIVYEDLNRTDAIVTAKITHDKQITGSILYCPYLDSKVGKIIKLEINEEDQGKGYGTLLMQHALKRLINDYHCTEVTLIAIPEEPSRLSDLIRFYERMGGKVVSKTNTAAEFQFTPKYK